MGEAFVDQLVCEWLRAVERCGQNLTVSGGDEVGGVGAVGQGGVAGVVAVGGEDPVVAFDGDAASEVGVGGDDWRPVAELAELGGLLVSQ